MRVKVPTSFVQVYTQSGQKLDTDVICSNPASASDCDLFFIDNFVYQSTQFYTLNHTQTSNLIKPINTAEGSSPRKIFKISSEQTIEVILKNSKVS